MRRYGAGPSGSTTTTITTEDSPESLRERRIRRLRLILHAGDNDSNETKTANSVGAEKEVNGTRTKRNGLIHRERPAGRESPQQHLGDVANGVADASLQHGGPKVYGIVQRVGADRQQEVMAREWTSSHLQDEMKYIREVRDSLEKVRERMYGQFGGMQQSMQKLTQDIKAANAHRRSLESEVKVRTSAMESFDQMNSSLITANLSLQKSLLENCQNRMSRRDEAKTLRSARDKAQEQLRDKERELAAAQAENRTLRLQVETSTEAHTKELQELSAKLQREYRFKLEEEQQRHREEIERLQAQLDEYIRRLEETERSLRTAEAKIVERDERIMEVERLLDCMGREKGQLQKKLQEGEQRLRLLELGDTTDGTAAKRSQELRSETADLRERIKHLNDMVFCQQRKVKAMIEEAERLRAQVAQKDMFISELLDRIAIVECENNELEDKLTYFMSIQNRPRVALETMDIGVGCDLLPSREAERRTVEPLRESTHLHPIELLPSPEPHSPENPSSPTHPSLTADPLSPTQPSSRAQPSFSVPSSPHTSLTQPSFLFVKSQTQQRTFSSNNPPPSRLDSSLLKYTPVQYSRMLQSSPVGPNGTLSGSPDSHPPASPVQSGTDEVDADKGTESNAGEATAKTKSKVYSPFIRLMEITKNIKITDSK